MKIRYAEFELDYDQALSHKKNIYIDICQFKKNYHFSADKTDQLWAINELFIC